MLAFESEGAHLPRSLISAVWQAFDSLSAMHRKPTEDVDREVRSWMRVRGWDVSRTNYDPDREVYAWRHDCAVVHDPLSESPERSRDLLRLCAVYHLDELKVARAVPAHPDSRLVVVRKGLTVTLDEPS